MVRQIEISKMKTSIFSLVLVLSGLTVLAQKTTSVKWHSIDEAQELTLEDPRPLFIEFTAKWCGWCKKMDKTTFQEAKVVSMLNEDFYAVKIDFDYPQAFEFKGQMVTGKELARNFGVQGLPTMIVIEKDLESHYLVVGYQQGKQLRKKLSKSL